MKNKLIVGLGNPGKEYDKTRHNIGFMAVDYLAESKQVDFKTHKKSNSEIAETEHLILAKPHTFMNNSGRAVKKLISYFNVADSDILVIYDDVDLSIGEVRYREEGGSAGHKGMQSIIDNLNTNLIKRIRIGVGDSGERDTSDYVLGKFSVSELKKIKPAIADIEPIINEKFISERGD